MAGATLKLWLGALAMRVLRMLRGGLAADFDLDVGILKTEHLFDFHGTFSSWIQARWVYR